jgi:hypothetical protein
MPRKSTPRPFTRRGLHRLECPECPGYTYSTVAALEAIGLPSCGCGARFQPERLELAALLGVEDAPAVEEYRRELQSAGHGQAWASGCGRRDTSEWRTPETIAAERVEQRRREVARKRRLAAIAATPALMPF